MLLRNQAQQVDLLRNVKGNTFAQKGRIFDAAEAIEL
jgi:hypothetical protein